MSTNSNENQKSIDESVRAIFEMTEARENAGRDAFEANWQASLELMLLVMDRHLVEQPGRMLPMQIKGEEEWVFYQNVQAKIDLPPDTCAVFITPSAFTDIPVPESAQIPNIGTPAWERNAHSIIVSGWKDHTVVMQVSLPGLELVGIDVFEDGSHLADYRYNTIEECLEELTKVTWIYFNPRAPWTKEQIKRYTENWFSKTLEIELGDAKVHDEYSYVHHPELLGLTPIEAVLKAIEMIIPKDYDNLENAIEIANDLNRDFELGEPIVTREGILKGNEPECRALLGRIAVDMDQHLDALEELEGITFSRINHNNEHYRQVFDGTAKKVYEAITGRACPESINIM
jgi:hypothetical protein